MQGYEKECQQIEFRKAFYFFITNFDEKLVYAYKREAARSIWKGSRYTG